MNTASPLANHNDLSFLIRAAVRYHVPPWPFPVAGTKVEASVNRPPSTRPPALGRSAPRPHVFIVAMEPFNANLVHATTEDGRPLTPFFNSLNPQGIHVKPLYGHSAQMS